MLAIYFLALIAVATVSGHPDGAPLDSCDSMTPIHSTYLPQPTASPFSVTLSKTTAAVGELISITLQASDSTTFQGFLLKGIASGQTTGTAGAFTMTMLDAEADMPCKYLDCSGNSQSALTHIDSSNKTIVQSDWSVDAAGTYNILATVTETYSEFWVQFSSLDITVS